MGVFSDRVLVAAAEEATADMSKFLEENRESAEAIADDFATEHGLGDTAPDEAVAACADHLAEVYANARTSEIHAARNRETLGMRLRRLSAVHVGGAAHDALLSAASIAQAGEEAALHRFFEHNYGGSSPSMYQQWRESLTTAQISLILDGMQNLEDADPSTDIFDPSVDIPGEVPEISAATTLGELGSFIHSYRVGKTMDAKTAKFFAESLGRAKAEVEKKMPAVADRSDAQVKALDNMHTAWLTAKKAASATSPKEAAALAKRAKEFVMKAEPIASAL